MIFCIKGATSFLGIKREKRMANQHRIQAQECALIKVREFHKME